MPFCLALFDRLSRKDRYLSKTHKIIAQTLSILVFLAGCAGTTSPQDAVSSFGNVSPGNHTLSIRVDGLERQYLIHVPQVERAEES